MYAHHVAFTLDSTSSLSRRNLSRILRRPLLWYFRWIVSHWFISNWRSELIQGAFFLRGIMTFSKAASSIASEGVLVAPGLYNIQLILMKRENRPIAVVKQRTDVMRGDRPKIATTKWFISYCLQVPINGYSHHVVPAVKMWTFQPESSIVSHSSRRKRSIQVCVTSVVGLDGSNMSTFQLPISILSL